MSGYNIMTGPDLVGEAKEMAALKREGALIRERNEQVDEAVESIVKSAADADGYKAQRDALMGFIIEKGLHREFGDLFTPVDGKTAPYGIYKGGERKGIVKNRFRHLFDVAFEKSYRDGIAERMPHKLHLQAQAKDKHW